MFDRSAGAQRVAGALAQHDLGVLRVRVEHEGPGADEVGGGPIVERRGQGGRSDDAEGRRRRRLDERGVGLVERDDSGVLVDDRRAGVVGEVGDRPGRLRPDGDDVVEVALDDLGGERRAVGERHIVAEMEGERRRVVADLPRLGEPRDELARGRILLDERVEQLPCDVQLVVAGAAATRVEVHRVGRQPERERAALLDVGGFGRRGGCRCCGRRRGAGGRLGRRGCGGAGCRGRRRSRPCWPRGRSWRCRRSTRRRHRRQRRAGRRRPGTARRSDGGMG